VTPANKTVVVYFRFPARNVSQSEVFPPVSGVVIIHVAVSEFGFGHLAVLVPLFWGTETAKIPENTFVLEIE